MYSLIGLIIDILLLIVAFFALCIIKHKIPRIQQEIDEQIKFLSGVPLITVIWSCFIINVAIILIWPIVCLVLLIVFASLIFGFLPYHFFTKLSTKNK